MVSTNPSSARLHFGDGRLGEVRRAADIPAGIAENKGKFPAFALDADFPALLRMGAMEAPGGQSDISLDCLVFRKQRITIPLRVSAMGP